jgi:flavin-dependent dehydrogenase
MGLLRKAGLLKHVPPPNLAARAYFENVEGLDDTIMLFFDGMEHPGYGWVFPTAPGSANVGCGIFFDSRTPQPTHLRHLIQHHPYLQRILRNARQVGPIKGHPLRTDFSRSITGKGRILVTGEAIGLVNPITGEGIDYALESAQLAANAIVNGWGTELDSQGIQKNYRAALDRKFRFPFTLGHLAQRLGFRDGIADKVLSRIQHRPHLHRVVVNACFGLADPVTLLTPRTFWELLRP